MDTIKRLLTPYVCPGKKVSVGCEADGGYVIMDPGVLRTCYSYGVGDNVSFETELNSKYNTFSYLFDHTIDDFSVNETCMKWTKQGIAHEKTNDCDTLLSHLLKCGTDPDMILKMENFG